MTGPVIPADQWPEDAVALVWSAVGLGKWVTADSFTGTWEVDLADVPMPAGWDWRVPVMRPSAEQPRKGLDWARPTRRREAAVGLLLAQGYKWQDGVWVAPQPAQAIDLEQCLRELYRAYVRLLESGRDRIRSLGGDCDPVDVMEQTDIDLRKVRDLLALIDGQVACRTCNGYGEIGGLLPNGGGYDSQSCPDCNSEQPPKGEGE